MGNGGTDHAKSSGWKQRGLNMKVAMMQPSFLPWQGFFELIYQSERFIFLDDFQFSVQSYHQRNRLFSNLRKVDWYTVPIQKSSSFKLPLNKVSVMETIPWRVKMWKRIRQNYSKALYYGEIAPLIENWLLSHSKSLAENNIKFIMLVCNILKLAREFRLSSQFSTEHQRSEKVLALLRWCEADQYYCARGSFDYMLEDGVFPVDDIKIHFQDFEPQKYQQVGSPGVFIPYLSVLDALMNIGPSQTMELIMHGTKDWLSWDEMVGENLNHPVPKEDSQGNNDLHE
jgi:hypothetical protein